MPVLVHLADERELASIRKNGLKARNGGVFAMPVLLDFYVSHQWMREMRRWRGKTYIAVYFRVPDTEKVWSGRYNEQHKHQTVADAIRDVLDRENKMGFEVFIERTIKPKEIIKVKLLQQNIGWRYYPESKGRKIACSCPRCIAPGQPKTRRLLNRMDPPEQRETDYRKLMERLRAHTTRMHIILALKGMGAKRRYADPNELAYLADAEQPEVVQALAELLLSSGIRIRASCCKSFSHIPTRR
jgi:phage pi2 protein 07